MDSLILNNDIAELCKAISIKNNDLNTIVCLKFLKSFTYDYDYAIQQILMAVVKQGNIEIIKYFHDDFFDNFQDYQNNITIGILF